VEGWGVSPPQYLLLAHGCRRVVCARFAHHTKTFLRDTGRPPLIRDPANQFLLRCWEQVIPLLAGVLAAGKDKAMLEAATLAFSLAIQGHQKNTELAAAAGVTPRPNSYSA